MVKVPSGARPAPVEGLPWGQRSISGRQTNMTFCTGHGEGRGAVVHAESVLAGCWLSSPSARRPALACTAARPHTLLVRRPGSSIRRRPVLAACRVLQLFVHDFVRCSPQAWRPLPSFSL